MLGMLDERLLLQSPALVHLAARDFLEGRVYETELADGELAVCIADGRAECSALHRAVGVEVASARVGIEDRAGLVVGEVFEGCFVVGFGEELARSGVAGKTWREAYAGGCGAGADLLCEGGVGGREGFAEGLRVQRRDGEDADATLVAAGAAGQPVAGALGCGGEGGVEDGEEGQEQGLGIRV